MRLVARDALDVLELFRVPYEIDPEQTAHPTRLLASASGAELHAVGASIDPAWARVAGIPAFVAIADEQSVARALEHVPREWAPREAILDEHDVHVGHVWRATDGSVLLPFDPEAAIRTLLREEYVSSKAATAFARRMYYRLRPAIPRFAQLALRRRFVGVQERAAFPAWPTETALHDLLAFLLLCVEDVCGEPVPWIAPWPTPHRWSIVLTHDVEQVAGYGNVRPVTELERAAGVRSAWYFVPERDYAVEAELVRELWEDGFEVGVHGLHHDGRDLSPGVFEERIASMRSYAKQWGAVGFRSPATQRDWLRISRLGFDHDSSYSDVATYEPQGGGSCSWYPFFVGDVVELPITLPMDHTLFELLGREGPEDWLSKARTLRERGGMALLLTHPDYQLAEAPLAAYESFLAFVGEASDAWVALPRDVAAWWRRRAASTLRRESGDWQVVGPAAGEAQLELGLSTLGIDRAVAA